MSGITKLKIEDEVVASFNFNIGDRVIDVAKDDEAVYIIEQLHFDKNGCSYSVRDESHHAAHAELIVVAETYLMKA